MNIIKNIIENKRGDLWISAALYTALGIILVTLILSVGMPFVNKLKERNTILQTKNVIYEFDAAIREVYGEGFGSRRPLFVEISEGDFAIDELNDVVEWSFITEEKLGIEPDVEIKEGNLRIFSEKLGQGYKIRLYLDYGNNIDLELGNANLKTLSGKYNLIFLHKDNDAVEIRESA
ncbi:hypothetical protein HYT56_01745 [Candidatus Woesearchaeota archaeon]|nr:hypothetical protein [Candidatus Woesearchaeota archaeon]